MGTRVENTPFFEHPGWHYPAGWGVRGSAGWRADGPAGQRRAGGYTGRRVRKSVGQRLSKSAGWLAGGSASRRGGRPVDRRAGWSVSRQLGGSADRRADGPTGRRDGGPAGRRAGDALGPDRELPHEVLPARSITAVLELAHPQLSRQDPRTKLALTPPFPRWPVVKMAPRARCDCGRWSFRMISDECDGRSEPAASCARGQYPSYRIAVGKGAPSSLNGARRCAGKQGEGKTAQSKVSFEPV